MCQANIGGDVDTKEPEAKNQSPKKLLPPTSESAPAPSHEPPSEPPLEGDDALDKQEPQSTSDKLLYVQALYEACDYPALGEFFVQQSEYEIASLLESFPPNERLDIWPHVPTELKGEVLAELDDEVATPLIVDITADEIGAMATELDAQDIAEILDNVEDDVREQVVAGLDNETREKVEALYHYNEDVVGAYMDPETVSVGEQMTLSDVQSLLRSDGELLDDQAQELLVIDDAGQMIGLLSLVDIIKYPQSDCVADHIDTAITVLDSTPINEAAVLIRAEDLRYAPVIDATGKLVGQLNAEDILSIIRDDADSTLKHLSGVSDDEELFAPILTSAKSRSVWLGINLATAFLAAAVIGQFEAVLSKVVALAVLMPVVASMGGIAGSQTLTVVIRGLAMGQIGGSNRAWLFNKELWVGAINGIVWAVVVAAIAHVWFGDAMITTVIALAIAINMTAANVSGIAVPLALKEMKIDPALSASVILTTVTDIVGFLSFLGLASALILN